MTDLLSKLQRLQKISPAAKSGLANLTKAVEKAEVKRAKTLKQKQTAKTVQDISNQGAAGMTDVLLHANPFIGPVIQTGEWIAGMFGEGEGPQTAVEVAKDTLPIAPAVNPGTNQIWVASDLDETILPITPPGQIPTIPTIDLPNIDLFGGLGNLGKYALVGGALLLGVMLLRK